MGIFRVNSFIFLFKLETGAIWIGMGHFTSSVIVSAFCVLFGFAVSNGLVKCEVVGRYIDQIHDSGFCQSKVAIPALAVVLKVLLVYLAISYKLVKGTENRCHRNVRPMLFAYIFTTFVSALITLISFIFLNFPGVVVGLVGLFYHGYQLIVLYSMHEQFSDEFNSGLIPVCYKPDPH